ncbi:MAG: TolC family protein [Granulosicoccus sp.]
MNTLTKHAERRFTLTYVAVAVALVVNSFASSIVAAEEPVGSKTSEPLPKLVDPAGIIDPDLLSTLNAMWNESGLSEIDDVTQDEGYSAIEPALGAARSAADIMAADAVAGEVASGKDQSPSLFAPADVTKNTDDPSSSHSNESFKSATDVTDAADTQRPENFVDAEDVSLEQSIQGTLPESELPSVNLDDEDLGKLAFGELLRQTLADNPGIVMARERVEQAVQQARQVGAYRFPTVALSSSLGPEYNDPVDSEDAGYAETIGKNLKVTATHLLYDGGTAEASYDRSNRLISAAEAESQIEIEELFLQVVTNYVDYWRYQLELSQAKQFVETMNMLVNDLDSMFKAGATSKLEVDFARARVASARGAQSEATASMNNAFSELGFLVPDLERFIASSPDTFSDFNLLPLQSYLDKGAASNSGFVVNQMNTEATQLKVKSANGLFKPTLNVELSSSFIDDEGQETPHRFKTAAKFLVNYTFYSGGERRGGVRRAEAQLRELEAERRQLERDVFRDIDQSYNGITASRLALDAVNDEIAAHEELQRLNKQNLALGTVNIIELIDVEERLFNANSRKNEVIATLYQEYFTLMIAAGYTQDMLGRFELELASQR